MSDNKSALWDVLRKKWAEYKELEKHSGVRDDFKKLESEIEQLQKDLGVFNKPEQFDIRWNNRNAQTAPSQVVEKAVQVLGDIKKQTLAKFADETLAEECYLADYLVKNQPELAKNPSHLGQMINLTLYKYRASLIK